MSCVCMSVAGILNQYRARNKTTWGVRDNMDPSTVAERIGGIRPNRTGAKRTADQVKADEEASKKAAALLTIAKTDTSVPTRHEEQQQAYVSMQTRAFAQVLDAAVPAGPALAGMAAAPAQHARARAAEYMLAHDEATENLWDKLMNPKSEKPHFVRAIDCMDNAPRRPTSKGMPDLTPAMLTPDQRREYERITPIIDAYAVFNTNQACGAPSPMPPQLFRLVSGGPGMFCERARACADIRRVPNVDAHAHVCNASACFACTRVWQNVLVSNARSLPERKRSELCGSRGSGQLRSVRQRGTMRADHAYASCPLTHGACVTSCGPLTETWAKEPPLYMLCCTCQCTTKMPPKKTTTCSNL